MAHHKKKRTKKYQGEDVREPLKPVVHHYNAVVRSPLGEWWHTHRRGYIRWVAIGAGGVLVVWLLFDAIRAITGS